MFSPQEPERPCKDRTLIYFPSRYNFLIVSPENKLDLSPTPLPDSNKSNLSLAHHEVLKYTKYNLQRILQTVLVAKQKL